MKPCIQVPASLKLTVPLILLLFAAILSTVNLLYHVPQAERVAEEDSRKRLTQELSRLQSTLEYMQRDPKDAARRMGIRQQTSGEQFLEAQRGLHVPSREENLRMLGGAKPELAVTGRRLMNLMLEARLLRSSLDIEGVLAPGPLADMPR